MPTKIGATVNNLSGRVDIAIIAYIFYAKASHKKPYWCIGIDPLLLLPWLILTNTKVIFFNEWYHHQFQRYLWL